MALTFGLVTDLHFGPRAYFRGKLRKLSHEAPALTARVVAAMNAHPDVAFLVNLGDDIEDADPSADLAAYGACQSALRGFRGELVNVAGNHDSIHLTAAQLLAFWGREGTLYYTFDRGGFHFVVLHTQEVKDQGVHVDETQRAWLRQDLAATALPTVVLMHHSASEQDLRDSRWFSTAPQLALVQERAELRALFEASGKVRAVFNGHVHRNHFDVIRGIPYVSVQSLIENLDEDAPGRPAMAHALVEVTPHRIKVRVLGEDPAAYQIDA